MAKNIVPISEITEDVINEWKSKHPELTKFTVNDNGEKKTVIVRTPTNMEIDYAAVNLTTGKLTQYGITLFNTCQLGGDIIKSEAALRTVGKKMSELIEDVEISMEKL